MKNKLLAIFTTILLSIPAFAQMAPVCTSGQLPQEFQGTFKTPAGNVLLILQEDKILFDLIPDAYLKLASCVKNEKRFMTITDSDPSSLQNAEIFLTREGNLSVTELESDLNEVWIRVK